VTGSDEAPIETSARSRTKRARLIVVTLGALAAGLMGWKLVASSRPRVIEAHIGGGVDGLAFSRSGTLLASASAGDETLRIWSVDDGKLVRSIESETLLCRGFAFTSDDSEILAGGGDGAVRVFSVATGAVVGERVLGIPGKARMSQFCVSPDGMLAATYVTANGDQEELNPDGGIHVFSSIDVAIEILSTRDLSTIATVGSRSTTAMDDVNGLALSPTNDLVVEGGTGGAVLREWRAGSTSESESWGSGRPAFSPDGKLLALADPTLADAGLDPSCRLLDVSVKRIVGELERATAARIYVSAVEFSTDGDLLFEATTDPHEPCSSEVRVFSPQSGKRLRTWRFPVEIECLAVSPSGHLVAAGASDGRIFLLNPRAPLTLSR
jgi:WD40 repeat protein